MENFKSYLIHTSFIYWEIKQYKSDIKLFIKEDNIVMINSLWNQSAKLRLTHDQSMEILLINFKFFKFIFFMSSCQSQGRSGEG